MMKNCLKDRRKITTACFLEALFLSFFFVIPFGTAFWSSLAAGRTQLDEIQSRLSNEKEKLTQVNSREKNLLVELENLEREVSEKKQAISALQDKIANTESEAGLLKMKLVEARNFEKEAESTVAQRLIAMYKYVKRGYIKVLADAEEPWQFLRRVKYLKAVMAEEQHDLTDVMETAVKRTREAWEIEKRLLEIEDLHRKEQSDLENLEISSREKVLRLMAAHKEKELSEKSIRELQNAAKDLKRTLAGIQKRPVADVGIPTNFGEMRGKLAFPYQGKVVDGQEFPEGIRQELQKGVMIALPAGSDVRAVFSGRVDFSGKLKGYGELIILNHGDRFFTVSAHLSKRTRFEGDLVKKDDPVGVAGMDGTTGESRFYFEIRKGGRNLDPLEWFAVK